MLDPLTTTERVRELGGLDDESAYLMFRLVDDAALEARIDREIASASAWLQSRAPDDYATGDTIKDILFAEAEAFLALQNLYETLKMRKVTGTHFPLQTEGSERFEELIDVEMPQHIRKFIDSFVVVEEKGAPFAAAVMVLGDVLDRTTIQQPEEELSDLLNEANSLSWPPA